MPRRKILYIALAMFVIAAGLFSLSRFFLPGSYQSVVQSSGKALIGGPFSLTNHKGEKVTNVSFQGKYMLITFGYTYCPDICPAELQVISAALDQLGPQKADKIAPIFVTIDPARDDVKQMAEYMSNFHKNLIGLTGSEKEVKAAAKAYRVYYNKVEQQTVPGEKTDPDSYLMDHSAFIYLMDQKGNYLTHFRYGVKPDDMAKTLAKYL